MAQRNNVCLQRLLPQLGEAQPRCLSLQATRSLCSATAGRRAQACIPLHAQSRRDMTAHAAAVRLRCSRRHDGRRPLSPGACRDDTSASWPPFGVTQHAMHRHVVCRKL